MGKTAAHNRNKEPTKKDTHKNQQSSAPVHRWQVTTRKTPEKQGNSTIEKSGHQSSAGSLVNSANNSSNQQKATAVKMTLATAKVDNASVITKSAAVPKNSSPKMTPKGNSAENMKINAPPVGQSGGRSGPDGNQGGPGRGGGREIEPGRGGGLGRHPNGHRREDGDDYATPSATSPNQLSTNNAGERFDQGSVSTEATQEHRNGVNATPPGWVPVPTLQHQSRVKVKITVAKSSDSTAELRKQLQVLLRTMQEADSTAVFGPWRERDRNVQALQARNPEEIPKQMQKIKAMFDQAKNRPSGGTLWLSVHMAYTVPFVVLKNKVKQHGSGDWSIEIKNLDAEDETSVGWLPYSHSWVNRDDLQQAISEKIGEPIELRWGNIWNGTGLAQGAQRVNGILIIAATDQLEYVTLSLHQLYQKGREPNTYPLGMYARFIPDFGLLNKEPSFAKFRQWRDIHDTFQKGIKNMYTEEILATEKQIAGLGNRSAREVMMQMTSLQDGSPLFHSIYQDYRGLGYNITTRPAVFQEAQSALRGFLVFLLSICTNESDKGRIKRCFTAQAVERARASQWDPTNQCCISAQEKAMMDMDMTEDSIYIFDLSLIKENTDQGVKLAHYDTGSLSTFGMPNGYLAPKQNVTEVRKADEQPRKADETKDTFPPERNQAAENNDVNQGQQGAKRKKPSAHQSVTSEMSGDTLTSRITNVENSVQMMAEGFRLLLKEKLGEEESTAFFKKYKMNEDAAMDVEANSEEAAAPFNEEEQTTAMVVETTTTTTPITAPGMMEPATSGNEQLHQNSSLAQEATSEQVKRAADSNVGGATTS
jgi:hypothetical protein